MQNIYYFFYCSGKVTHCTQTEAQLLLKGLLSGIQGRKTMRLPARSGERERVRERGRVWKRERSAEKTLVTHALVTGREPITAYSLAPSSPPADKHTSCMISKYCSVIMTDCNFIKSLISYHSNAHRDPPMHWHNVCV